MSKNSDTIFHNKQLPNRLTLSAQKTYIVRTETPKSKIKSLEKPKNETVISDLEKARKRYINMVKKRKIGNILNTKVSQCKKDTINYGGNLNHEQFKFVALDVVLSDTYTKFKDHISAYSLNDNKDEQFFEIVTEFKKNLTEHYDINCLKQYIKEIKKYSIEKIKQYTNGQDEQRDIELAISTLELVGLLESIKKIKQYTNGQDEQRDIELAISTLELVGLLESKVPNLVNNGLSRT